jgi:outer membrane protein assembly factor BamB
MIFRSVAAVSVGAFCLVAPAVTRAAEFVLASRNNSTIVRYDLDTGAYLGQIGPGGALRNPVDVEIRSNGNYLISNFNGIGSDVLEYTPTGTLVRTLDSNQLEETTAVKERGGRIYALANDTRRVGAFDATTGAFLYSFANSNGASVNFPADMEFAPNSDELFITVEATQRVQVWDPASGTFLRSFGSEIGFAGLLGTRRRRSR